MRSQRIRLIQLATLVATASICFGTGGCSGVGGYLSSFNPCGTILNCDATTYEWIAAGYEGPGVDVDVDPFCTYPPYCENDPIAP